MFYTVLNYKRIIRLENLTVYIIYVCHIVVVYVFSSHQIYPNLLKFKIKIRDYKVLSSTLIV